MADERAKVSSIERIRMVFIDSAGALKTGLTVTMRIMRASDAKFLKNDATWVTPPGTEYTATETDATNEPGAYHFLFTLPSTTDTYLIRADGSASASPRYQFGSLKAVKLDETDIHKLKAALVNKQQQNIATGVVTIFDDDASTTLVTMTPSLDSLTAPTINILTPS